MNTNFYRKTSKQNYDAFTTWKKNCPWESHHTVSFVAGFNAAMKLKKKTIVKKIDK